MIDFSKTYITRIITFLLILIIISPPFNTWEKLILLSLSTTIIFFSKTSQRENHYKIFYILFFLFFFILQNSFLKNYVIVNHIVLPTSFTKDFDYIKKIFPEDLERILKKELKRLENDEKLLKNIKQPGSNEKSTLFKDYAFQSENLWTKFEEGKIVLIHKNMNFWDFGPSALNDTNLNFGDPKKKNYKNNLIFPTLIKLNFSTNNHNSNLCFTGNLIYEKNKKFVLIENKSNKCIRIDKKKDYFFLDYKRDLKINVKNNFLYDNSYLIYNLLSVLLILSILINFFKFNKLFLFFSISFYIVLFIYLKFSPNPVSAFSETFYFDRGMDGMAHYGFSRIILNNLFLGNIYEGLRGVESIFFYMPLSRYLNAFFSIFFGDTILGNIYLISFFPIIFYKLFTLFLKRPLSKILTFIFIFLPIFESLGFALINYINFTVDGYAEGICYFFLILMIYLFLQNEKKANLFFIGFLSFLIIGLRPNYLAFIIPFLTLYAIYIFVKKNDFSNFTQYITFLFLGGSPFFLIPLHNYIYSNEIVLLIQNQNIKNTLHISFKDYIIFFQSFNINENLDIFNHLNHYIKIYELWFFLILLNLFVVFYLKSEIKIKILSISLIFMHFSFFFFLGDPRYSMGAWLISFIVFLNTFFKIYYPYLSNKIFSAKQ